MRVINQFWKEVPDTVMLRVNIVVNENQRKTGLYVDVNGLRYIIKSVQPNHVIQVEEKKI